MAIHYVLLEGNVVIETHSAGVDAIEDLDLPAGSVVVDEATAVVAGIGATRLSDGTFLSADGLTSSGTPTP